MSETANMGEVVQMVNASSEKLTKIVDEKLNKITTDSEVQVKGVSQKLESIEKAFEDLRATAKSLEESAVDKSSLEA